MNDIPIETETDEQVVIRNGDFKAEYKLHPTARLFPLYTERQHDELMESIRRHGQQQPVVVHGELFLDGRNRVHVLNLLGLPVKVIQFKDLGTQFTPSQWIVAQNLHRRHLRDDQILAIATLHLKSAPSEAVANNIAAAESGIAGGSAADGSLKDGQADYPQEPAEKQTRRSRGRHRGGERRDAEELAKVTAQSRYRAERMLKVYDALPEKVAAIGHGTVTLRETLKQLKVADSFVGDSSAPVGRVDAKVSKYLDGLAKRLDVAERGLFWQKVATIAKRELKSLKCENPPASEKESTTASDNPPIVEAASKP